MKKFRFSLETVLDYKQQALDSLRAEHGAILAQVRAQEQAVQALEEEHRRADDEFTQRKLEGINVLDALNFEQYLRAVERRLQTEHQKLEALERQEEKKRSQVVEARKETATIEKLKEHKLEDYRKAVQKSEETMIEEFVSTTRAMAAAGSR
ncbi:MAG: flagellar export protein FliJ [Lawsonibacter sp.]|nr:flagellar export protein FliJ [Lawsonibacter sp.]MCI9566722.1 flagellar export protein FliJ [Lawsonibacter sp.]